MSVLFKVATMSGKGGRATEEGSSAMVNGGCHQDSTGGHCRASIAVNKNQVFVCVSKICIAKKSFLVHIVQQSMEFH